MIAAQKNVTTKPNVLVIEGAGFIGSFLCEALLTQNCRVICLDKLSPEKKENLKKCLENPDFIFIERNFEKPLLTQLENEKFSYVFDLSDKEEVVRNLLSSSLFLGAKILSVSFKKDFSYDYFVKNFPSFDFRVVYLPMVYGPRMEKKEFEKLVREKEQFPPSSLFITDAIFGLTKAMFSFGTKGKIFHLKWEGEEKLKWKPRVVFEEGIKETLIFFQAAKLSPTKIKEKKEKTALLKGKYKYLFLFLPSFFAFLVIISLPWLRGFLGWRHLWEAYELFRVGNFENALEKTKKAEIFLNQANQKEKIFTLGKELARGLTELSMGLKGAKALGDYIFQEKKDDVAALTSQIKINLDRSYFYFSLIGSEFKNPFLINPVFKKFLNIPEEFDKLNKRSLEIRSLLNQGSKVIEILPWLIGTQEKRRYLVLFQNNNELRPTGGFIGSFAFLTFDKGRLIDFEVQDVYWADGQLKGHVEPPPELKKYLGEANWYLRDANWDPDFPTSARKIQWFLEKEIGRVVDGVIGINLFVAQRLLEAVGEIEIPDYQEKINASNFFERAEYYSEIGFFPGSTQKEDFLGSVGRILLEKIRNASDEAKLKIIQAIYQSLEKKDIIIFLNNQQTEEVISSLGWEGGIKNINCVSSENRCLVDYLMIVEANVGVNKVNYFIEREVNHEINVSEEGEIGERLRISYQNLSPSENFPGGKYKNYLRILVPQGSQLEEVKIEGKEVSREKIVVTNIKEKTSFGFLVEVPVKEKREVEISYRLGERIQIPGKTQYLFLVQKQSGTKEENFNLKIYPSGGTFIIPVIVTSIFENNAYVFNQNFDKDFLLEMFFIRE